MRLWLDSETALLLGIELIDAQNHILERAQYASIGANAALDKSAFIRNYLVISKTKPQWWPSLWRR